ncbi:unnamed protein product, partial [Laminaria digitata]
PSPESRVTLVTQCSADRLSTVLKQALRWGGDVSLAVLVPSAPSSATAKTLSGIHELCSAIDRAHSAANPPQEGLSLDVAVLEGAEADPARHDHCGALYPVNTLRNLALLQARDDEYHSAQAVFLVDSDCVPSERLHAELSSPELQRKLSGGDGLGPEESPAAIVVPCLEFAPGCLPTEDVQAPSTTEEVVGMLQEGRAQGFHVDYFPKGHGPTDFDRWAGVALEE